MSTIQIKKVSTKGRKSYPIMCERYESVQEMVKDCQERKITSSQFDNYDGKSLGGWYGVQSYDEALDMLKNGYQPTVEKLQSAVKAKKVGVEKRISFQNDVYGFAPIVPLALKGVPTSMVNMTMKPIKCKVIDVYYDITTNSGTSSEDIIKNGQKLLEAIMTLEKQGYKFNLYAMQSYSDESDADILVVKIKSSNAPIDLKKMSFPLTHTAFFRVIGFDWYGKCPKARYRSAYGRALRFTFRDEKDLSDIAKQMFGDNAMYISGRHIQEKSDEYIKGVLTNTNNKEDK